MSSSCTECNKLDCRKHRQSTESFRDSNENDRNRC